GNVILFSRNCETPKQLFELNQALQKEALDALGYPMFISIDQEGGMVTRIFNGATFFPGAMTIARTNQVNNAYQTGLYMGEELLALGVNMNLAPVLDVNNNPLNPVIGVRSYSDDPKVVSTYGNAFIEGLQKKVFAVGKHFPGHGDTFLDSHLALPKVDHPVERLEKVELVPFRSAIQNGLKGIMSSHIDFPAFTENGLPVTLSKRCLTSFLREDLKFEGLIVTDGMEMKAVQDKYGTVEASLMSVVAGANLVCICHTETLQIEAFQRFKDAVASGELPMDVLDERVARVLAYKKQLDLPYLSSTYDDIKRLVENETHQAFALDTVRKALKVIKGKVFKQQGKTLFIGVSPKATTIADDTDGTYQMNQAVKQALPTVDTIHMPINPLQDKIEAMVELAKSYDQVVLTTYNGNVYRQQIHLIDQLASLNLDLYVIAMRNPYDMAFTDHIKNYTCLYEYTPNSVTVLAEYLSGKLHIEGVI
ncbi:MAG: beta-N-acetylhexosaminidase, partial [Tenericutes bacterium HGW-Tenericutes-8]